MPSEIIDGEVRRGTATRNNLIRAYVKTGRSQASVAREFGISAVRIHQIVNRKDSQPEDEPSFLSKVLKVFKWPWKAVSGKWAAS